MKFNVCVLVSFNHQTYFSFNICYLEKQQKLSPQTRSNFEGLLTWFYFFMVIIVVSRLDGATRENQTKRRGGVTASRRVVARCNGAIVIWIVKFLKEGYKIKKGF